MTNQPTPLKPPVLRITRADLIEQIMREGSAERLKQLDAAQKVFSSATQAFVTAVNAHAEKLAQPAIRELKKLSELNHSFRPTFSLSYDENYSHPQANRDRWGTRGATFEGEDPTCTVKFSQNEEWHSKSYVEFKLTPELKKLR